MTNASSERPAGILAGLRVIDLSRMLSGPYATMMLADHGAQVIKVEPPVGDTSRTNGPWREGDARREWAGYFVSLNRGKKSVMLDLKTEAGRDALRRLVKTADVLVENYRPGVMERLGLSYENLAQENPRLVYAAIRGFGDPRSGESPYTDWPSYDVVAQAMGGLIGITGPDERTPTKVGPGVGDIFAGMMMAFAILAAVRKAEQTGQGQFVDIAMYDAMISLCERIIYQHDIEGSVPAPAGNGHPLLAPFGLFPARDGWVSIGVVDDGFWRALTQAMERPDLAADARLATKSGRRQNAAFVNETVSAWTRTLSKVELAGRLGGKLPFGPVNDVRDILTDPHVAVRQMIVTAPHPDPAEPGFRIAGNPVKFAAYPTPDVRPAPRLGEDTDDILGSLPDD